MWELAFVSERPTIRLLTNMLASITKYKHEWVANCSGTWSLVGECLVYVRCSLEKMQQLNVGRSSNTHHMGKAVR